MKSTDKNWIKDCLWLTLGLGLFYFLFLGLRPLAVPDEARYSEIPREMAETGQYLIPHLNYIKYYEKPDLFYWLQSFSIHLFGTSEWAMRFWVCIFGILGCLVVYLAARKLFNRRTAIYSSLVLSSSLLYYVLSHLITLDLPLSFFLTTCLLSFLVGTQEPSASKRRFYIYIAAVCSALAVLTKGLIGIVFPVAIIGLWVMILNEWKLLTKLYLPSALLIFFLIAIPWHFIMNHADPNWAHFYFFEQQFLRYSTLYAHRYAPVWFFIPILLAGLIPWVIFLPQAIKNAWPRWAFRKQAKVEIFLLLWATFIFIFFSFSYSKLIPYIIPALPPLALLIGKYLASKPESTQFKKIFISMFIISLLFYVILNISFAYFYDNSIKPLALPLKSQLKPNDMVISYDTYYQDLPFYLQRRVVIMNWENELSFGMTHQDVKDWVWRNQDLPAHWKSGQHLFLVTPLKHFSAFKQAFPQLKFYFIAKDKNNIIISNQENSFS
jgi:4-amino-4-deoxy-L-arabinose transferase-like glycosyltransferase